MNVTVSAELRAGWAAAHAPVAGVPRWARVAALAIPYTVVPSSLWRIAVCTFHIPIARGDLTAPGIPSGIPDVPLGLYVVLLSIGSEVLAFTAVGLVSTWGETFPSWMLVLGGRRIPRLVAVVPAAIGASILTLLWTWTGITVALGLKVDGSPKAAASPIGFSDWHGILAAAAYAPLLLWGPLLAVVTINYWRRRQTNTAGAAFDATEVCRA